MYHFMVYSASKVNFAAYFEGYLIKQSIFSVGFTLQGQSELCEYIFGIINQSNHICMSKGQK